MRPPAAVSAAAGPAWPYAGLLFPLQYHGQDYAPLLGRLHHLLLRGAAAHDLTANLTRLERPVRLHVQMGVVEYGARRDGDARVVGVRRRAPAQGLGD